MTRLSKAPELVYLALLFALFVLPKLLQRFRIPSALTNLGLGAAVGMGLHWFHDDTVINLFSTLGITTLFLYAGLEVDLKAMRDNRRFLLQHLGLRGAALAATAALVVWFLHLEIRAALVLALALLTPSTGFILDSLDGLGAPAGERRWIKAKALASEILALAVLFAVMQSGSWSRLGIAALALLLIVALLPLLFFAFARLIAPWAPKSEFAFLLMVALGAAAATRALDAYYLVGAFLAGVAAQRFRQRLPALASDRLIHAVELFASFFIPFYFFHAGLDLRREDFSFAALLTGLAFLLLALPLRVAGMVLHRYLALRESPRSGLRIAVALLPTLVFTLVLAGILRERFAVAPSIFGGLIIYTLVNTLIPGFTIRMDPELSTAMDLGQTLEEDEASSAPKLDSGYTTT